MVEALVSSGDLGSVVINATDMLEVVLPLIFDRFSWVITIVKAVGILFILYIIYIVFSAFSSYTSRKRIRKIEKVVSRLEGKVDLLLNNLSESKTQQIKTKKDNNSKMSKLKKKGSV